MPVSLNIFSGKIGTSYNNTGYDIDNVMSVNNAFFEMFSTRFIYGNPFQPLPNPNSVVLTESSAHKLFGNENPVGKVMVMWQVFPSDGDRSDQGFSGKFDYQCKHDREYGEQYF